MRMSASRAISIALRSLTRDNRIVFNKRAQEYVCIDGIYTVQKQDLEANEAANTLLRLQQVFEGTV